MKRLFLSLLTCLPLALLCTPADAGDIDDAPPPETLGPLGLTLGFGDVGLALGNVPRVTGLRLNLYDVDMEEINGINLTFLAGHNSEAEVRGLSLGLFKTSAGTYTGIPVAFLGLSILPIFFPVEMEVADITAHSITGVALNPSPIGITACEGRLTGLSLSSLTLVQELRGAAVGVVVGAREGGISGAALALAAVRSEGPSSGLFASIYMECKDLVGASLTLGMTDADDVTGVSVSPLLQTERFTGIALAGKMVSDGDVNGISVNGRFDCQDFTGININLVTWSLNGAMVAREIKGVNLASWTVAEKLYGCSASYLLNHWQEKAKGITLAGLFNRGEAQTGVSFATGFNYLDESSGGAMLGGVFNHAGALNGLACAGVFNYVRERQTGVSFAGLLNVAGELHGVQIGLLNYARNNPPGLRLLPLANCHF